MVSPAGRRSRRGSICLHEEAGPLQFFTRFVLNLHACRRGKGWLKISTSHWQLLGYSLSPSSPAATSDAPEWVVTYFSSTLFTPAGLDVYARTPTALSDDFVDDIVRKLEEMGGEVGQPVQNGGMFRIPHLEGNKA